MSSWLLRRRPARAGGGGAGAAAAALCAAAGAIADGGMSFITGGLAAGGARGFRLCAARLRAGGLFGGRRLGFVVGDDAPDRRQNLLHRGFLDLCRLRHLQLHIINALACVLHQARQDLPVPDMQAGIFIAQA